MWNFCVAYLRRFWTVRDDHAAHLLYWPQGNKHHSLPAKGWQIPPDELLIEINGECMTTRPEAVLRWKGGLWELPVLLAYSKSSFNLINLIMTSQGIPLGIKGVSQLWDLIGRRQREISLAWVAFLLMIAVAIMFNQTDIDLFRRVNRGMDAEVNIQVR